MDAKDIRQNWGVRERIAVCISGSPSGQYWIFYRAFGHRFRCDVSESVDEVRQSIGDPVLVEVRNVVP
jgi:hypothetical protein